MNIVVIGSINMDMIIEVDEFVLPSQTILGNSLRYAHGGKGANQAMAVSKLGQKVTMLGCVGQDAFGKEILQSMRKHKINVEELKKTTTATGLATININRAKENQIIVLAGANSEVDVAYIAEKKAIIQQADIIIMQLEIPKATISAVLELVEQQICILNPAPYQDISDLDLSKITYLIPNETELNGLLEKMTLKELLEKVKHVIVTLGSKGSCWYHQDQVQQFNAYKVKVQDTVAAGDSFVGGFAVGLAQGKTVDQAIEFATKVSAIAVTRIGAQDSIPSLKEVEEFIG